MKEYMQEIWTYVTTTPTVGMGLMIAGGILLLVLIVMTVFLSRSAKSKTDIELAEEGISKGKVQLQAQHELPLEDAIYRAIERYKTQICVEKGADSNSASASGGVGVASGEQGTGESGKVDENSGGADTKGNANGIGESATSPIFADEENGYSVVLLEELVSGMYPQSSKQDVIEFYWAFRRYGVKVISKQLLVIGLDLFKAFKEKQRESNSAVESSGTVEWAMLRQPLMAMGLDEALIEGMECCTLLSSSSSVSFADLLDLFNSAQQWKACGGLNDQLETAKMIELCIWLQNLRNQDHVAVTSIMPDHLDFVQFYCFINAVRTWNSFEQFHGYSLHPSFLGQVFAQAGLTDPESNALSAAFQNAIGGEDVMFRTFHALLVLMRIWRGLHVISKTSALQQKMLQFLGVQDFTAVDGQTDISLARLLAVCKDSVVQHPQ